MVWIWRTLGALGGLIVMLIAAGAALPKAHVVARSAVIPSPPEEIWKALVEVEASPSWRPDVIRVERLEDRYGNLTWRETGRSGRGVTYEATESIAPTRLVRTIIERNLPYGGNWVIEIAEAPGGSTVKITENGEIYNPVFRLLARAVFGYTRTIDDFLRYLGLKFGAQVTPAAA
jgi:uncharacterized protein YndB with AHSA1/START domain